jgi:hypothetical protein
MPNSNTLAASSPATWRVDRSRLFLRHPVAGFHDDLREIAAVAAHRLGKLRAHGLARRVVGAMQEQNGHGKLCGLGAFGIFAVCLVVHVPGVGPEEAVALQCGGIGFQILLGDHIAVARHVGAGAAAEPATRLAHARGRGRLAEAPRIALAEHRLHRIADIDLEVCASLVEILLIEEVIVPLAGGIEVGGINRAVDQRQPVLDGEACGDVGHAEARHAHRLLRMMRSDVPHHGAAPVVADPGGAIAAERRQQLEHVLDDRLLGEILVTAISARAAVAPHVRRDTAKAEGSESRKLVSPRQRELRPAMAEDQQRRAFRSAGEIARRMAGGLDGVFGDRECHGKEKVPWKSTPAQPNSCVPCATA